MTYQTVFDASSQGFRGLNFVAVGVLFVAIGAIMVFSPRTMVDLGMLKEPRSKLVFRWFFFGFSLFFTVTAVAGISLKEARAANDLRSGRYSVVSGPVENFEPMPPGGHGSESFDVGGVAFSYSDDVLTPGFNTTASHGGPIRNGLPVRIAYENGLILRLEVGG